MERNIKTATRVVLDTNYQKYLAAGAIEAEQTIVEAKKLEDFAFKVCSFKVTEQQRLEMLEKLLKQPVMADVYAKNGVKPQDVPAYIDSVKNMPEQEQFAMISAFALGYHKAAESMVKETPNPMVDGEREAHSLRAHLSLFEHAIAAPMQRFLQSQKKADEKNIGFGKKVMRWVEEKFPGAKVIAAGFCVMFTPTQGLVHMSKMLNKKNAPQITAQKEVSPKASNGKTLPLSAKDFGDQGRS